MELNFPSDKLWIQQELVLEMKKPLFGSPRFVAKDYSIREVKGERRLKL